MLMGRGGGILTRTRTGTRGSIGLGPFIYSNTPPKGVQVVGFGQVVCKIKKFDSEFRF